MRFCLLVLAILMPVINFAQEDTADAQKKLQQKTEERLAQRSQKVTVTKGELDDLKTQIIQLKAEIAQLRGSTITSGTPPKQFDSIEIGMSKQDVLAFVKQHKEFKLVGITADSGIRKITESEVAKGSSDVNVRSKTNVGTDTSQNGEVNGQSKSVTMKGTEKTSVDGKTFTDGTQSVNVERTTNVGMHETVTLQKGEWRRVPTGSHEAGLLRSRYTVTDYGDQYFETGRVIVRLTDGVVSGIEGTVR